MRAATAGILASLALAAGLYAPFWNGRHTFDALRSASGDMLNSPGWLLRLALEPWFGWEGSRPVVVVLLTAAFLAGYGAVLAGTWRAGRPARHVPQFAFAALVLYLCTVSWWLWPWYALWLLPPAALLVHRRAGLLAAVITGAALTAYLPINFRELFWGPVSTDAMPNSAAATMFLPPLTVWGLLVLRGRRR